MSSAIISSCGLFRTRLERNLGLLGPTYAYFGVNPSTADASINDATVRKWIGFTIALGGGKLIVGNAFSYRATDVRKLATVEDPVGPDNIAELGRIIEDADILVPCWGNISKVPEKWRLQFGWLKFALQSSGKPVMTFGFTKAGDPKHPLMLGYNTPLQPWQ